jgi:hypothetical protein
MSIPYYEKTCRALSRTRRNGYVRPFGAGRSTEHPFFLCPPTRFAQLNSVVSGRPRSDSLTRVSGNGYIFRLLEVPEPAG